MQARPAVLTVSTDHPLLETRAYIVEAAGARSLKASSVDEALNIVRQHPLCAAILCFTLSGKDVEEISWELKKHHATSVLRLDEGGVNPAAIYDFVRKACGDSATRAI